MILEADNITVEFQVDGRILRAVDGVSLTLAEGETLAVVGESGSGKSTLAFTLMGVYRPKAGRIRSTAQISPIYPMPSAKRVAAPCKWSSKTLMAASIPTGPSNASSPSL